MRTNSIGYVFPFWESIYLCKKKKPIFACDVAPQEKVGIAILNYFPKLVVIKNILQVCNIFTLKYKLYL